MSQNTFSATELQTYANVQIAAETLYGLLKDAPGSTINIDTTNHLAGDKAVKLLQEGNDHTSKFSETQAKEFVENWEIVSHLPNTKTGFSGTLFRVKAKDGIPNTNLKNGDLVISFRSTEFIEDYIHDNIATNTHEIADKGWAFGQISDMEEWFSSLNQSGLIPKDKQITVTGYSLGGHLATAFHILHQNENLIKNTFTFNGAGVGSMGGDDITTDKELRNAISFFQGYPACNNLNQIFSGKVANVSVINVHNQIKTSLDSVITEIGNSNNISAYITALEKAEDIIKLNVGTLNTIGLDKNIGALGEDIETIKKEINVCKEQLKNISDAITRLLGIAEEYQRINKIKLTDVRGEKNNFNKPVIGNIEASVGWATCCPRVLMNFQVA